MSPEPSRCVLCVIGIPVRSDCGVCIGCLLDIVPHLACAWAWEMGREIGGTSVAAAMESKSE